MLKLHTFFSVASCRYLVITALAAILSWTSAEAANAPTTYLDADLGDKLENLGRLYDEATQGLKTGARQIVIGPSEKSVPVITEIIRRTAVFSTQQLRPAGNDTIQGGGTNITRNGSCVVGYQDNGTGTPYHAFRWVLNGASSTPLDLGTLGNATLQSFATDANLDCSVVVGYGDIAGGATQHAFRWTSPGPMEDLNVLAGATGLSRALGVSNDGSVIVGEAEFPAGAFTRKGAFRWAGGSFADLIPGLNPSLATAVSADGTVVVGKLGTSTASSAFRWTTQNPVAQSIGPLTNHLAAAATAVSDNGKIVV
jgi:probable HAF family extracellular repeat protein